MDLTRLIIQVGNNMCFLSNWSSWFIFTSLSKCKAECVRVLVCVCVCVRSVDSTYNLSGGKQGLKNFQGATPAAQWRPSQQRARVISTFECICADVLMSRESMGNGDELQKHWYKALFQCDKHHYWRLQTYTCTDCHALAYMTDTLYIVLCYLHSFKEATTQLAQPRLSPRCLPLRHAVCRDPTACWGLKVQWWPVYALRWCKSASGEKKKTRSNWICFRVTWKSRKHVANSTRNKNTDATETKTQKLETVATIGDKLSLISLWSKL